MTAKLLISLPDDLTARFRALIPARKRSGVIKQLLEAEIKKREKKLYQAACAVEADKALNDEMHDWDETLTDGIDQNESW